MSAVGTTDIVASGFNPGLAAILFSTSVQDHHGTVELDAEVRSGVKSEFKLTTDGICYPIIYGFAKKSDN
jgi:hypothetical protein